MRNRADGRGVPSAKSRAMIRIVFAVALTVILAGCLDSLEEEGAKQTSAVRTTATPPSRSRKRRRNRVPSRAQTEMSHPERP